MNKELDKLLCLLDGKITAYRMNTNNGPSNKNKHIELIQIQLEIQELWLNNKEAE